MHLFQPKNKRPKNFKNLFFGAENEKENEIRSAYSGKAVDSLSVTLETSRWRAIRRIFDAEVHRREARPASVGDQQLPRGQERDGVDSGRAGQVDVRTRDAEDLRATVHRHAEHAAGHRAVDEQEVRSSVDWETGHRRHVVVVFNHVATVC